MAESYIHSRYCKSFRQLMYMGLWTPDMLTERSQKIIFFLYALIWRSALIAAIIIQGIDLYLVIGNLKKMMFNLCTSTIVSAILVKMVVLFRKREKLRHLYTELWEYSLKYTEEEDVVVLNVAYNKWNYIRKVLYGGVLSVIAVVGFSSYFSYKWGRRILPFAGYFPMEDTNNDVTYLPALLYECVIGIYTGVGILESDMTMLGLVSQIQAHCQILSKNLINIKDVVEKGKREINEHLRNDRVLNKLKELVKRHLELLKYCEDVEYIFNNAMAFQLLAGFILLVLNGVETTRLMQGINMQLCYQIMYIATVLFDLYMICHHFTALTNECMSVGFAAYSGDWCNMDTRIKRTLCIIITRAQKPPRFTYGKLFIIDVNAYMHLLKNIYSWLMLFRQLEMK